MITMTLFSAVMGGLCYALSKVEVGPDPLQQETKDCLPSWKKKWSVR